MNAPLRFASASVEEELPRVRWLSRAAVWVSAFLRLYAGCFFASSRAAGAVLLLATALVPRTGALGALALGCAILTAYALGLVSEHTPPATYAYSALFLGLGAGATFASWHVALLLAIFGSAAASLLTAGLHRSMAPLGLPTLSLPFVVVYWCAISAGRLLGADWMLPEPGSSAFELQLPAALRLLLEALGGILFTPRADVGALVLGALALCGRRVPLCALAASGVVLGWDALVPLPPAVRFGALLNGMFAAVGLGSFWYADSGKALAVALGGALLCVVLTLGLYAPLGKLECAPLSLPFNLSVFAVLLIARQRVAGPARELHGM